MCQSSRHRWFAEQVTCHYLNQCWLLVNWVLRSKFFEIQIKMQNFHSRKCIWKCVPQNGGHFVGLMCIEMGLNALAVEILQFCAKLSWRLLLNGIPVQCIPCCHEITLYYFMELIHWPLDWLSFQLCFLELKCLNHDWINVGTNKFKSRYNNFLLRKFIWKCLRNVACYKNFHLEEYIWNHPLSGGHFVSCNV